jgi:hypothetical protein
MTRITKLFLAALVGLSALPFGCKSEVDKASKAVGETMDEGQRTNGSSYGKNRSGHKRGR